MKTIAPPSVPAAPDKLLRRAEVIEQLRAVGHSDRDIRKLFECGVIKPCNNPLALPLKPGEERRAYYSALAVAGLVEQTRRALASAHPTPATKGRT